MSVLRSEFKTGGSVVVGSLLGIGVGVSSLYFYSLGVFIKPLSEAFGWGRGTVSLGPLVGTAGAALTAVPIGWLVDRFGSKITAVVSLVLLMLCFIALGRLTNGLASFLVLTAALSLLTAGSSPLPYTRLVIARFSQHRGLALGLALTGTGIGGILVPLLLNSWVAKYGWRSGYFALAAVVGVATPIVWLSLRRAREPASLSPISRLPIRDIFVNPTFRLLALIFFLASMAILGTIVQFIPLLSDAGLRPNVVGEIASVLGVSAIVGRLISGVLVDRFPPPWVTAGLLGLASAGVALVGIQSNAARVAGAFALGLSVGAEADLLAFLVARYFSLHVYGQVYGAIYSVFLLGAALGPAWSGYLRQISGGYRDSLTVAAALLGLSALITLLGSKRLEAAALASASTSEAGAHQGQSKNDNVVRPSFGEGS